MSKYKVLDNAIKFLSEYTGTRAFNLLGMNGELRSRTVQFGSRSGNHIVQVNAKPRRINAIKTVFNQGKCTGVYVKLGKVWSEKAEPTIFKEIKQQGADASGFIVKV